MASSAAVTAADARVDRVVGALGWGAEEGFGWDWGWGWGEDKEDLGSSRMKGRPMKMSLR